MTKENRYIANLSESEVMLIQRIRGVKFGSIRIHLVNNVPTRVETINHELIDERKKIKDISTEFTKIVDRK